jgi:hypothetical protein
MRRRCQILEWPSPRPAPKRLSPSPAPSASPDRDRAETVHFESRPAVASAPAGATGCDGCRRLRVRAPAPARAATILRFHGARSIHRASGPVRGADRRTQRPCPRHASTRSWCSPYRVARVIRPEAASEFRAGGTQTASITEFRGNARGPRQSRASVISSSSAITNTCRACPWSSPSKKLVQSGA